MSVMAVTKQPIALQPKSASLDDFDQAIALIRSRLSGDQASLYTDHMAAIAAGLVNPSKQQFEALRLLFTKKVPDAPKDLNIHNKTSVEVIIHNFLEKNTDNFTSALQKAIDVTPVVADEVE